MLKRQWVVSSASLPRWTVIVTSDSDSGFWLVSACQALYNHSNLDTVFWSVPSGKAHSSLVTYVAAPAKLA